MNQKAKKIIQKKEIAVSTERKCTQNHMEKRRERASVEREREEWKIYSRAFVYLYIATQNNR